MQGPSRLQRCDRESLASVVPAEAPRYSGHRASNVG
jgi:hypothetical protein